MSYDTNRSYYSNLPYYAQAYKSDAAQRQPLGTRDPNTGHYYQADSAEDAHFIRMGRVDLVPGARRNS